MRSWRLGSCAAGRRRAGRRNAVERLPGVSGRGRARMSAIQRIGLEVQPVDDRLVDAARAPTTAPAPPRPAVKRSWWCTSHSCASVSARSTRPWWAPSRTTSCQQPPGDGRDRLGDEPRDHARRAPPTRTSESLEPVQPQRRPRWRPRRRRGARCAGSATQVAEAAGDVGGGQPLADDLLLQEVLREELLQAPAELVLAAWAPARCAGSAAAAGGGTAPSPRTSPRSRRPCSPRHRR